MSLDPDSFRAAMGRFATGVTVVTARDDAGDQGMTVSAFSSLSLGPPLALVCIAHSASMHNLLANGKHFIVNILSADQEAIARRFAASDPKRFDGIGYNRGVGQIPILDDVLAYLECKRVNSYDAGDHTIVVGEVETAVVNEARPLLYYRGGFAQLER